MLESASRNFARAHIERARSSHVHAALVDSLHDLCDLRSSEAPTVSQRRAADLPIHAEEGSDPGTSGASPHGSESGARRWRAAQLRAHRHANAHHSQTSADVPVFTWLAGVRVDLRGSLSGLEEPPVPVGSACWLGVLRSLPEVCLEWVGTFTGPQ